MHPCPFTKDCVHAKNVSSFPKGTFSPAAFSKGVASCTTAKVAVLWDLNVYTANTGLMNEQLAILGNHKTQPLMRSCQPHLTHPVQRMSTCPRLCLSLAMSYTLGDVRLPLRRLLCRVLAHFAQTRVLSQPTRQHG